MPAHTAAILTAIGQGLGQVGGLFRGDPFKRSRQTAQDRFFNVTQPRLEAGIPDSAILRLSGMIARSVRPFVNSIAGKSAAKFGSRSGLALGAGLQAGTSAIAQQLAQLFGQKIFSNRADLRASARGLTTFGSRQGAQV